MTPSNDELLAILIIKKMLTRGSPNMSDFLEWLSERLIKVYHENENMDFVHALKRYSKSIKEIEMLLSVGKC